MKKILGLLAGLFLSCGISFGVFQDYFYVFDVNSIGSATIQDGSSIFTSVSGNRRAMVYQPGTVVCFGNWYSSSDYLFLSQNISSIYSSNMLYPSMAGWTCILPTSNVWTQYISVYNYVLPSLQVAIVPVGGGSSPIPSPVILHVNGDDYYVSPEINISKEVNISTNLENSSWMVGYSGSDVTDLILDYTVPTCPDPEDPPECPEIPELVTGTGVEGQLALLNYWMEIQTMYPNYYKLFWDDYTTPMLSDVILPAGLRAYNESGMTKIEYLEGQNLTYLSAFTGEELEAMNALGSSVITAIFSIIAIIVLCILFFRFFTSFYKKE